MIVRAQMAAALFNSVDGSVVLIVIIIAILVIIFGQLRARVIVASFCSVGVTLIRVFSTPLQVRFHVEVIIFARRQLIFIIHSVKIVVKRVLIVLARLPIEVFRVVRDNSLVFFRLLGRPVRFLLLLFVFLSVCGASGLSITSNFLALSWVGRGLSSRSNFLLFFVCVWGVRACLLRRIGGLRSLLGGLTLSGLLSIFVRGFLFSRWVCHFWSLFSVCFLILSLSEKLRVSYTLF